MATRANDDWIIAEIPWTPERFGSLIETNRKQGYLIRTFSIGPSSEDPSKLSLVAVFKKDRHRRTL